MRKLIVAPVFDFLAGWMIDRYGPRKLIQGAKATCDFYIDHTSVDGIPY